MKSVTHPTMTTTLKPAKFFERLRTETVPYETIINARSPMSGYATFVEQTLTGPMTVVAKIDEPSFKLMPIGLWPVKGQSPLANAGALCGTVEVTKSGTHISTRYRYSIGMVAFLCAFGAVSAGLVLLMVVVTVFYPAIKGLLLLQGLAAGSVLFTLIMTSYLVIGGRQQRRVLANFLRKLCDDTIRSTNESAQSTDRSKR